MNEIKKQRNSVIELLRILCILMVIAGHYYTHGIAYRMVPYVYETYSLRILAMQLISFGADIANDLFIIVTGYYMVNSAIKGKRIFKLFAQMLFYAWLIVCVFHITGIHPLVGEPLKKALLPFWSGENWFVTCYLLLCLFIPFLNPFLKTLEQKQFIKLLVLLFIIHFVTPLFGTKSFWSVKHGLEQFIILYFIGAFIRLHGFKTKFLQNKWCQRGILFILALLWFLIGAGTGIIGLTYMNADIIGNVTKYFPVFSVLIASSLFVVALGIKPFYSKIINVLSGSVLGIYLIHDNSLVREHIWRSVSPNYDYIHTNSIFLHMAEKTIQVFLICLLIDQCRIWLLEYPLEKLVKKFKS